MKAHDLYITCHLASLYEKIGNVVNRRNSYIYRLGECCKTKSLWLSLYPVYHFVPVALNLTIKG